MKKRSISALLALGALVSCEPSPERAPGVPGVISREPEPAVDVAVTNPGSRPLAMTTGDFAYATPGLGIGVTPTGIIALETLGENAGKPPPGFEEWSLTSTGAGAAASAIVVAPERAIAGGPYAFFLPNGRPEVGVIEVGNASRQGALLGEGLLEEALASPFPSAISAPSEGPAARSLWVVDAVFGPGSSVRAYPYAEWSPSLQTLSEDRALRFTPEATDVDGDGRRDETTLGRLVFADGGRVGLVSFTFLAPAPKGAAGGVFAFESSSGRELGRIVIPVSSTVADALEFVGSLRATDDSVIVVSAVKGSAFEDIGGGITIYRVRTWSPFHVVDGDSARAYDQPEKRVATSVPNAVGITLRQDLALVLCAPFTGDGALEIVNLRAPDRIIRSVSLGPIYTVGFNVPGDPDLSEDGRFLFVAAETGLLRVEFSEQ